MANVTITQIDDLTAAVRKEGALLRAASSTVDERDAGCLTGLAEDAVRDAEKVIDAISEGAD